MTIEPAPLELDEPALLALGTIAVQSARLEWALVGLHAACDKSKTHQQHLAVGQPATHGKAIKEHLEGNSWRGAKECITWADEAVRLLKRRGDLMHSGWVVGEDDGVLRSHHMRSGESRPFDQAELDDLVYRLGLHVALGGYQWLAAFLIAEGHEDWIP